MSLTPRFSEVHADVVNQKPFKRLNPRSHAPPTGLKTDVNGSHRPRKIDPPSLSFGAAGNHDVVEALVAANTATTTDNFLYKITVASQG